MGVNPYIRPRTEDIYLDCSHFTKKNGRDPIPMVFLGNINDNIEDSLHQIVWEFCSPYRQDLELVSKS